MREIPKNEKSFRFQRGTRDEYELSCGFMINEFTDGTFKKTIFSHLDQTYNSTLQH